MWLPSSSLQFLCGRSRRLILHADRLLQEMSLKRDTCIRWKDIKWKQWTATCLVLLSPSSWGNEMEPRYGRGRFMSDALRTSDVYSVSCYESYIYVHKNFIGRNKALSAGWIPLTSPTGWFLTKKNWKVIVTHEFYSKITKFKHKYLFVVIFNDVVTNDKICRMEERFRVYKLRQVYGSKFNSC